VKRQKKRDKMTGTQAAPATIPVGQPGAQPLPGDDALGRAIAAHFGVEPQALKGFVVAAEYELTPDVDRFSSVWSAGVPGWRLKGFAAELMEHLRRTYE